MQVLSLEIIAKLLVRDISHLQVPLQHVHLFALHVMYEFFDPLLRYGCGFIEVINDTVQLFTL